MKIHECPPIYGETTLRRTTYMPGFSGSNESTPKTIHESIGSQSR
jgi:hypothetical protein